MSGQSHLPVPEAKGKARSPVGPCSGQRIYLRQRSLKANGESDILKRFHSLLVDYFTQGMQHEKGLPTVAYCADKLAYSARYFGDLIHHSTGGTAIGYIHDFVIDQAKNLLMKGLSVGEVADLLGFDYPNHFSRLFKKVTGLTRAQIHIAHKVLCVIEGRFGAASGENVAFYDSFQSNKEAGRYLEDTSRHRALVFK